MQCASARLCVRAVSVYGMNSCELTSYDVLAGMSATVGLRTMNQDPGGLHSLYHHVYGESLKAAAL